MRLLPGLRHQFQAVLEQTLGVSVHALIRLATDAQVTVLGARAGYRTDNAVALRVAVSTTNHSRRRTRTEGQGRKLRQHILAGRIGVVQDAHRGTVPRGRILASDNQGVVDSARINHGGGDSHRVHKAQASVRNIEVQGVARQIQAVVHTHRDGGLKVIASHRSVNQQANLGTVNTCLRDSLLGSGNNAVLKGLALSPAAASTNTGKTLQQALGHAQTLIGLGQLLIEVVARDDLRRQLVGDGQQSCISVANVRVHANFIGGCIQQWCGP